MDVLYSDTEGLPPDEIVGLIRWLPDDSAFHASRAGGLEYYGWNYDRVIATLQFEQLQMNGFNFVKANQDPKKQNNLKPPTPIRWPGRKIPEKKGAFGPIVRALARGRRPPPLG